MLKLAKDMEVGNFDATQYEIKELDITPEELIDIQIECIAWTTELNQMH